MKLRELSNYCRAGTEYFDAPGLVDDHDSRYPDPTALDEATLERSESGIWVRVRPIGLELPEQGWKVHVSSTLDDAHKVLDIVWRCCTARRTTFKFVRSEQLLLLINQKGFSRSASGKFITIYPRDDDEFLAVLAELEPALRPFRGPYILSDLRHRDGPLYVRYGAFEMLWCTADDGEPVPAMRAPDGRLVPDLRSPAFTVPPWLSLPAVLDDDLAARQQKVAADFPYAIERAIQFSNSGGVYVGTDTRNGERVVVREARPHAGLDRLGNDSVHRLCREREVREHLAGLDCVPRLIDHRIVAGHHYLIEEYVEGQRLFDLMISKQPLVVSQVSDEERAAYTAWVFETTHLVENALRAIHRRGVSYGDLHPSNILIRPDGGVVFVDFEFAAELAEHGRPLANAPGFTAPPELTGADADRYLLERVRLMALVPLMGLVERNPAKLSTAIDIAAEEFPIDARLVARLQKRLVGGGRRTPDRPRSMFTADPVPLAEISELIVRAIRSSATPERPDRLFPGDPAQFRAAGGVDVETGSAGVLYALRQAGVTVPGEYIAWTSDKALGLTRPAAGLFSGLHGVAVVLDDLGRRDAALQVLELVRTRGENPRRANLRDGQAGIALALLRLTRRGDDSRLLDEAVAIAERLERLVTGSPSNDLQISEQAGLMRGMTGLAALFLRLYEELGDPKYLTLAETCLHRDLGRCKSRSPGTCYVLDGSRHLPYPENGSIGLAMVMAQYLRHREHPIFEATIGAVRKGCDTRFVFQAGLLQGRAGILLGLRTIGDPADAPAINGHLRRLGWYALSHRDGLAFPGAQNLRLSMDYGTGSAGVLLAIHAVRTGSCHFLPALESVTSRT